MLTATWGVRTPRTSLPHCGACFSRDHTESQARGLSGGWSFCPSQAAPRTLHGLQYCNGRKDPRPYHMISFGRQGLWMVAWALSCQRLRPSTLHSCTGRLISAGSPPRAIVLLVPTCPATRWTILQGGQFQPWKPGGGEFAIHEPGPGERGQCAEGEAERMEKRMKEAAEAEGCPPSESRLMALLTP